VTIRGWNGKRVLEDAVLTVVDLEDAMAGVPTRELLVVGLLAGLCDWKPLSMRECGVLLGVSHERIRQLHGRALDGLTCG
jgi:DNA-directed RNA polymerase sigma subunit (sigma70/sigma32)